MTDREGLLAAWAAEEREQPEGWDFSCLDGRMTEDGEPWDLAAVWRAALASATRVLDIGTGGGEFLARFADVLPACTVAMEGWPPNIGVAAGRLAPCGVGVVGADDDPGSAGDPLPFADGSFDLVLDRHEGYRPEEVFRVLTRGGTFLTQQVGGDEFGEIRTAFGMTPSAPHVTYGRFRADLADAGFEIVDGGETTGHYVFDDVAAMIAYVQLVPWDVPDDFSVGRYSDVLLGLHAAGPAQGRPLRATRKRFWLRAGKPG
ncbi:class I SAM-dependent methyltransferase [Flexivirga caeni]|uniref:Class I SAM-dependent methyltransferase n=1 Tax=Flexivirga caeni TaxID=2294115 RepID=A0A3M9M6Y9_9MICO|nr:methyltransferase domain-containing protein [Flexivirga caeni]RNI21339.1 class I SAM-dependent methyltransferase [Flexivirga caeni]